ncbi:hypothetical protein B296_00027911 [Ensete ventricosum]|uniref:Uncharacterized protein n=1 Tax=Ensete ventricosum TaxID=4639 RepID=A0A426XFU0_ENSVE|nr:hypothetical protein B296_00027911 [Ensete ventricosum]
MDDDETVSLEPAMGMHACSSSGLYPLPNPEMTVDILTTKIYEENVRGITVWTWTKAKGEGEVVRRGVRGEDEEEKEEE